MQRILNTFKMTTDTLHTISLSKFKSLFPGAPQIGVGDDFFIMDIRLTERHQPL